MKTPTNNIIPQGYKMTELGALPEEWEVVKLGEIMVPDRTKLKREDYKGDIPMVEKIYFDTGKIAIRGQRKTNTDIYIADKDRIITSKINFHQGAVAITYSLVAATTHYEFYKVLEKADIMYLWRYLRSEEFKYIFSQEIKFRGFKKEANFNFVKDFKIPLPPLPEQQKIAAVLSAVQEAKEKTEAVIAVTKALKKSMMKHLFTYGPVSPEEVENIQLKETEIGPVPKDWEVVKLGEVAESFIGGGTPPTDIKEYWNGSVHWTTSKKINDLYLLNGEKKITEKGLRESSTHLIPKDNLIIGTRVGVGKVAINKIDIAISQDLTGVFIDNKKYSLEYLAYQISTVQIQKYLKECMRGTTIKGIPRDDLKRLPLQIPPLPIQQKIASILSAIDVKIEAEENKKKALEELFKSLLHNLMTAKIRVNQLEVPS